MAGTGRQRQVPLPRAPGPHADGREGRGHADLQAERSADDQTVEAVGALKPVTEGLGAFYLSDRSFAVHHWFVITLFALFYGVLKWVYRKRGKAVADE